MEILAQSGKTYNLSPRKAFCNSKAGTNKALNSIAKNEDWDYTEDGLNKLPNYDQMPQSVNYALDMCAIYLDTDKEKEIKSGINYPFERLN